MAEPRGRRFVIRRSVRIDGPLRGAMDIEEACVALNDMDVANLELNDQLGKAKAKISALERKVAELESSPPKLVLPQDDALRICPQCPTQGDDKIKTFYGYPIDDVIRLIDAAMGLCRAPSPTAPGARSPDRG